MIDKGQLRTVLQLLLDGKTLEEHVPIVGAAYESGPRDPVLRELVKLGVKVSTHQQTLGDTLARAHSLPREAAPTARRVLATLTKPKAETAATT